MNNQRFEVKEKESEDYEEWFDCQWCKESFPKSELHEEDTTFFVKGKFFEDSSNEEYMMQAITHA